MKTIVICSSVSFYYSVVQVARQLEAAGYQVAIPRTAQLMAEANDFNPTHFAAQVKADGKPVTKADFIRENFTAIAEGDAILVINETKHGISGYIGANVFLEIGVAFYLKKQIYILNDLPENSPFEDELKGMMPIILRGDLTEL